MVCNKFNWQLLKECAEKLTEQGKVPFTRKQLIACVQREHPERKEDSLNPMIQGMTVNLRGGAPGGIGKDIFISVGSGLFELYSPNRGGAQTTSPAGSERETQQAAQSSSTNAGDEQEYTEPKSTEDEIRDLLMQILYYKLGREGSRKGVGKTSMFDLREEFPGWKCFAERNLAYQLPTGISMTHRSDILISNEGLAKHVSIEVKHRSSVTDQFKCRSYDIIHMKNTLGSSLFGVMVYVKSTKGISIEHAKSICYPFDYFFGIPTESSQNPAAWEGFIEALREYMQ